MPKQPLAKRVTALEDRVAALEAMLSSSTAQPTMQNSQFWQNQWKDYSRIVFTNANPFLPIQYWTIMYAQLVEQVQTIQISDEAKDSLLKTIKDATLQIFRTDNKHIKRYEQISKPVESDISEMTAVAQKTVAEFCKELYFGEKNCDADVGNNLMARMNSLPWPATYDIYMFSNVKSQIRTLLSDSVKFASSDSASIAIGAARYFVTALEHMPDAPAVQLFLTKLNKVGMSD